MEHTGGNGADPSDPTPAGKPAADKDAKAARGVQTGTAVARLGEGQAQRGGTCSETDQDGAQRRAKQLGLPGIEADAEGEEEQQETADELDGEGGRHGRHVGEEIAAADLEVARVGGGAQQQPCEARARQLRRDVQHHARERRQPRAERPQRDQRVHVPAGNRPERVDEQGQCDDVDHRCDQRAQERRRAEYPRRRRRQWRWRPW